MSTNKRSSMRASIDPKKIVKNLLDNQKTPNRAVRMDATDLEVLCEKVQVIFASEPMLLEVPIPVKIAGDVHGQFADLLRIFSNMGYPPQERFLFLGDYVDRGRQGIETIALLFAYKVLYPERIFLLRGNHECSSITLIYGFYSECTRRYSLALWRKFMDTFKHMPIAALVDNRILCMHGGLSPDLHDLKQIQDIERPQEVPETGLMCDLLWSDPNTDIPEGWAESSRGISFQFAENVVADFCEKFNIELVCRAHQVVEDGYLFFAKGKLLTVFSAPNYCSEFENAGAVFSISKDLECSFWIFRPLGTNK